MGLPNNSLKWGLASLVLCNTLRLALSYQLDDNPYSHREVLDNGKYILEWLVNLEEKRIMFNLTVETKGFIGFGLNTKGQMDGADLVVGGVMPNGRAYLSDRHINGRNLEVDRSQDYKLESAREISSHTYLSFSRSFETCDTENDLQLKVTGDVTSIIWAYGEDDDVGYHFQNRGTLDLYLLDPDLVPRGIEDAPPFGNYEDGHVTSVGNLNVWTMSKGAQIIPAKDTTYMCTFHKAPVHNRKLHAVGFRTVMEGAVQNIHHLTMHRCRPPPGISDDEFFGPWLRSNGGECYKLDEQSTLSNIPNTYCQEIVHGWGVGGRANFFPEHVGLPINDESDNEWYMLQTHYDNPDQVTGLEVRFAQEVFYTQKLREHDAGLLYVGLGVPGTPSILIPPSSIDYTIFGHCGSACTDHFIPPEGINIFSTIQHTHIAGRGVRTKQIRGSRELPWIVHDDNYNFNYQQFRTLPRERKLLPGDSVVMRCTYDTTDRGGNVTVGSYRTTNEMCLAFLNFYPYIRGQAICSSEIRSETYWNFLGIRNLTWSDPDIEFVVTSPRRNAGLTFSQVGNNMRWTKERRRRLHQLQTTLPQVTLCPDQREGGEHFEDESIYDENSINLYQPPSVCNANSNMRRRG